MNRAITATIFMTFSCPVAWTQLPEGRPQFEVASVKPSAPPEQGGGAGSGVRRTTGVPRMPDPGLFTCDSCTLSSLVTAAFQIAPFQLGAPPWMESERFTVHARVPPNTTPEQLRFMQQSLLEQRFGLTYHHEQKEMLRCELVVAKGGPKLKASSENAGSREPGADVSPDGRVTARYYDLSMPELAEIVSRQVHMPVTDATSLQGKFDFTLTWVIDRGPSAAAGEADSGPTMFSALQSQLGLRLETKKGPVDRLVIDHAEKVPSEN